MMVYDIWTLIDFSDFLNHMYWNTLFHYKWWKKFKKSLSSDTVSLSLRDWKNDFFFFLYLYFEYEWSTAVQHKHFNICHPVLHVCIQWIIIRNCITKKLKNKFSYNIHYWLVRSHWFTGIKIYCVIIALCKNQVPVPYQASSSLCCLVR